MEFVDFLKEELGDPKENTIGEVRFCCPFCGETKYKFYVHHDLGPKKGLYHCKKCGEKGNPVTFIKNYYHVSGKDAFDILENRDITIDRQELVSYNNSDLTDEEKLVLMLRGVHHQDETSKLKPPPLPKGYKFLKDNMDNPEAFPFFNYLHNRGVTLEQIQKHSIAYIVKGSCLKADNETEMGIQNSVIFFTFDNDGKYQYWNTRSIERNPYLKSLNAPGDDTRYGKSNVIFNLNTARKMPFVVITEGVFDALTFQDYGVATFGKQVTEGQFNLLKRSIPDTTPVYVMLDSDALQNNIDIASKLYVTHKKTFVVPHGDMDANDMGMEKAFRLLKDNRIPASPEGLQSYYLQQKLVDWA